MTESVAAEFRGQYDRLLNRWHVDTDVATMPGRFGTTAVITCGPVGGEPVILLAGGGATAASWCANVAPLVADGYRVYAIDMIGDVGLSVADRDGPRTVDDLLDWLAETLDGLGIEAALIVGHSYGAMVALAFALAAPDRVQRLVLLDPNSCFAGMRMRYALRAVPLLVRPTAERRRDFLRWESGGDYDRELLELQALGVEVCTTTKLVVPKRPSSDRLHGLTTPLTVVLAQGSRVHDAQTVAANVRRDVAHADVVLLTRGTHHTLPWQPSDEVNAAIAAGLSGSPTSARTA